MIIKKLEELINDPTAGVNDHYTAKMDLEFTKSDEERAELTLSLKSCFLQNNFLILTEQSLYYLVYNMRWPKRNKMAKKKITKLIVEERRQKIWFKPYGFWYACGTIGLKTNNLSG